MKKEKNRCEAKILAPHHNIVIHDSTVFAHDNFAKASMRVFV